MSTLLRVFFLLVFSAGAFAESSISLQPPSTDVSVIYLNSLFGVVDGVLHGSGSQIMGAIFKVFNSAVLGLGGIVVMYTLIVSTLNTAHEGQFLGQKFSSIWVPVRTTAGLALLLPKASGYCMMQVFVMWVIVQGVGAADLVWGAALDYLNRGGVIISAQVDLKSKLDASGTKAEDLPKGARAMLEGQVCMLSLTNFIKGYQETLKKGEACTSSSSMPSQLKTICQDTVPDLTTTFNAVAYATTKDNKYVPKGKDISGSNTIPMPWIPGDGPFHELTGICGYIAWKTSDLPQGANRIELSNSDKDILKQSRALAVQQMYEGLLPVARILVNNSTSKFISGNSNLKEPSKYGYPLNSKGGTCTAAPCKKWGEGQLGFSGQEIWNTIADYQGVMSSYLNLKNTLAKDSNASSKRAFIQKTKEEGWLYAGSYFYDLIQLNGNATSTNNTIDTDSGLGSSEGPMSSSTLANVCESSSDYRSSVCYWILADDPTKVVGDAWKSTSYFQNYVPNLKALLCGGTPCQSPGFTPKPQPLTNANLPNNVESFVMNQLTVATAGQQNQKYTNKSLPIPIQMGHTDWPDIDFGCMKFFVFCMGDLFDVLWNKLIGVFLTIIANILLSMVTSIINIILWIPLMILGESFNQGLAIISSPGVNPILAAGNMGAYYINTLWQIIVNITVMIALFSTQPWGVFVIPVIAIILPLFMAIAGLMGSVGFIAAYYVPLIPYITFLMVGLGWFMLVIEAVVAAPIVGLGMSHPEGHDAFGKAETALNLLISIFLRPSLMIIGFITAISLSYIGVWMLTAGFKHALSAMGAAGDIAHASDGIQDMQTATVDNEGNCAENAIFGADCQSGNLSNDMGYRRGTGKISQDIMSKGEDAMGKGSYVGMAAMLGFFMQIILYISLYLTITEKAFSLIGILPDKVLRWIGHSESAGQEAMGWAGEAKQKVTEAGGQINAGMQQTGQKAFEAAGKAGSPAGSGPSDTKVEGGGGDGGGGAGGDGAGAGGGMPPVPPP